MYLGEIKKHCEEQIDLTGANAKVVFKLSGKPNKQGKKRLWSGGPIGVVVGDDFNTTKQGVVVLFGAQNVLDHLAKL